MRTPSRRGDVPTLFALLFLLASSGWAQKDMGNIVGVVKDSTGAVVSDAKVAVTDMDRGTIFPTTTNSSGEYVAGPLRIGQYTVTVEKSQTLLLAFSNNPGVGFATKAMFGRKYF